MGMAPFPAHTEGIAVKFEAVEGAACRGKARVPVSRWGPAGSC
jgi:hypothetical protein